MFVKTDKKNSEWFNKLKKSIYLKYILFLNVVYIKMKKKYSFFRKENKNTGIVV